MLTALSNLELHVIVAQKGRFARAASQLKLNQHLIQQHLQVVHLANIQSIFNITGIHNYQDDLVLRLNVFKCSFWLCNLSLIQVFTELLRKAALQSRTHELPHSYLTDFQPI